MSDLRTAVLDARRRLETKAIAATTNDADGAYMDAVKMLDQALTDYPDAAPQPVVDREAISQAIYAELNGSFGDFGGNHADRAAEAVLALLNGTAK